MNCIYTLMSLGHRHFSPNFVQICCSVLKIFLPDVQTEHPYYAKHTLSYPYWHRGILKCRLSRISNVVDQIFDQSEQFSESVLGGRSEEDLLTAAAAAAQQARPSEHLSEAQNQYLLYSHSSAHVAVCDWFDISRWCIMLLYTARLYYTWLLHCWGRRFILSSLTDVLWTLQFTRYGYQKLQRHVIVCTKN